MRNFKLTAMAEYSTGYMSKSIRIPIPLCSHESHSDSACKDLDPILLVCAGLHK